MYNIWNKSISHKKRLERDRVKYLTMRSNNYKAAFGISLEEYNELFRIQEGCCAICGKHQAILKIRLSIDHSHETGMIRGLLCQPCNVGLGMFKEDTVALSSAINYLKGFEKLTDKEYEVI